MSLAAEQKNYFQIYDEYASKYFGFEKESFAWRENCRDRDMTLLVIAYSLSNMYENLINMPDDVSSLKQAVSSMEKFVTTYKVNYDVYEAGVNVCYVPKLFGKKFNRELKEMSHCWYTDYPKTNKDPKLVTFISDIENYFISDGKSKLLSRQEIKYIYSFYDSRLKTKKTFQDILLNVGFIRKGVYPSAEGVLVSSDGAYAEQEHWYNQNYLIEVRGVSLYDKDWNDGDFQMGIMWCKPGDISFQEKGMIRWDTKPDSDRAFLGLLYTE